MKALDDRLRAFLLPFALGCAAAALATHALACSNDGSTINLPPPPPPSDASIDVSVKGPYLTSLSVTSSDGSGAVALTPAFAPNIYDYYVRCPADANGVVVSMAASKGAMSALTGPMTSSPAPEQTLSVTVNANQAIVATATAGKQSAEYWVRCLPAAFPTISLQSYPQAGTATPGYYLMGTSGHKPGYTFVLDGQGVPVWYFETATIGTDDVNNLIPGSISFFLTWMTQPLQTHKLNPLATTYATPEGYPPDTHELQILPNGDYLVFTIPTVTGIDLTGIKNIVVPGDAADATILGCVIVEFDPKTSKPVWTWDALNHFDPAKDSTAATLTNTATGVAVDAFHCNAIDIDPDNGNLLVSARDMDSVFYVELPSGKVLWKMGGDSYSKDGATYIPVADPFYEQHDARLQGWSQSTGTGQISVFDDESNTGAPARGLLLDVKTGADGSTPGATVAWQYQAAHNSSSRGSFRINADGSRVIGWGTPNDYLGRGFTELDSKGNVLLDFFFTDYYIYSYRAIKVPLSAFDLDVLRNTSGHSD
jgi:hypothetical protein